MGQNTSPNANGTARAAMEQALEHPHGVSLSFDTHGLAHAFRMKCYNVRARARELSRKQHQVGEPGYDTSEFDELELSSILKDGETYVLVIGTNLIKTLHLTANTREDMERLSKLKPA
jgi:hypothetical protein